VAPVSVSAVNRLDPEALSRWDGPFRTVRESRELPSFLRRNGEVMAHQPHGRLELFAILVLFAELPQRVAGRPRSGQEVLRPAIGVALALLVCTGIGWWLGPLGAVTRLQGLTAGVLVALAITAGALVADGVAQDLGLGGASSRFDDRSGAVARVLVRRAAGRDVQGCASPIVNPRARNVLRGAEEGKEASAACAREGVGDVRGGDDDELPGAAARRTGLWQTWTRTPRAAIG
jgi:hypothetical protein